MANAIEQIYDQLVQVFGGTNPDQVFTMLMPGTTLNPMDYSYDTTKMKPATVQEAESRLVDQMFDIAKVSGSSNGQRVSSQYQQALSVLVPKFNPMMPVLKKTLRDFLNRPVPANTLVDGVPFAGNMQQYYFKLYDNYVAVKLAWETMIVNKKSELLKKNPDTENEMYLEWYEQIAEAQLTRIDEALGKVLGVFAPSDMDAILGALASGPGGEVDEASNVVRDIQLASPDGGFFYPVNLTPDDWFLDLASDIDPVNLLKDPEFIAAAISAKRQALAASISQVQAMLNDMPTKGDIKKAADALQAAQSSYIDAQNNLLNTYADNTATAVEMYLAKNGGGADTESGTDAKSELDLNAVKASKAKGDSPLAKGATKKDGTSITTEDVQKLVDGQKKLITAQSSLQTSSQAFADAGMNLASQQASYFGELPVILARLQSQLADINNSQSDLAQAAAADNSNAIPALAPVIDATVITGILSAMNDSAANKSATAASVTGVVTSAVATAVTASPTISTQLHLLSDAATKASTPADVDPGEVILALNTSLAKLASADDITKGKAILQAAQTAAALPAATATTVLSAITSSSSAIASVSTDCTAVTTRTATADDVLAAVNAVANPLLRAPVVKKSDASQRFMELQLSFTSDQMTSEKKLDTASTQTSWSVDLFFGSASGSSSSSSAVSSAKSIDSNTEIKIGLKAAKVDISRGWFDPGVFKLSKNMNRISSAKVSAGTMPSLVDANQNTVIDWTSSEIATLNEAILPSFPVAMLIVKDVNITFKATESTLDSLHTVLDSKSAVGGGFLCFSASSSSASHSDHSSLSTRSQGTVININMPGPQILGWFLEMTPEDQSDELSDSSTGTNADQDLTIIDFINKLSAISTSGQ